MAASYPAGIKVFTPKVDGTDTVLASNVNAVQEEIAAVEQAVGVQPAQWAGYTPPTFGAAGPGAAPYPAVGSPATYASVAARLGVMQAQLAWLTATTTALGQGPPWWWRRPVAIIRCVGTSVAPQAYAYTPLQWGAADYDPYTMFTGGEEIGCPQSGWWQIDVSVWLPIAVDTGTHAATVQLMVGDAEAATGASQLQPGLADRHRIGVAYSGPWRLGERVRVLVAHNPGVSAMATASVSLSYMRDVDQASG